MLSETALRFSTNDGKLIPHYLDERDHPWLRLMWEEFLRFVGSPKRELIEHLSAPLSFSSPTGKRKMVLPLLHSFFRARIQAPVSPIDLRSRLFLKAAQSLSVKDTISRQVAEEFNLTTDEMERCLFADLPNERCITQPAKTLPASEMALLTNLSLVQGLLCRARRVEISLDGNAGPVVRYAKKKGLICTVQSGQAEQGTKLFISGPYSLFRCTFLYGRALGELAPVLSWCNRFELRAECIIRGRSNELTVRTGDPIFPSEPPKLFDSKLEERFYREFLKSTRNWDLVREPEPISAGGTLIFPDFALRHRLDPDRKWLLEIVGYWTPDYLRTKMERLREAGISNLVICISDKLNCAKEDFPKNAKIIPFKDRVEPKDVLRVIGDSDEVSLGPI